MARIRSFTSASEGAGCPAIATSAGRSLCRVIWITTLRRADSPANRDSTAAMAGFTHFTSGSTSIVAWTMFISVRKTTETSTFLTGSDAFFCWALPAG